MGVDAVIPCPRSFQALETPLHASKTIAARASGLPAALRNHGCVMATPVLPEAPLEQQLVNVFLADTLPRPIIFIEQLSALIGKSCHHFGPSRPGWKVQDRI